MKHRRTSVSEGSASLLAFVETVVATDSNSAADFLQSFAVVVEVSSKESVQHWVEGLTAFAVHSSSTLLRSS